MRKNIIEEIILPSDISCSVVGNDVICTKGSDKIQYIISEPRVSVKAEGNKITLNCKKGSKIQLKVIKSFAAHIRNLIRGLNEEFVYLLEACNVHFPMTLKLDKDLLIINNFLGEKQPRTAKILPGVKAEIKGTKITITSRNRESAGQTVANIEKATKIKNRDRRIFQDGIFLVEKPGRKL